MSDAPDQPRRKGRPRLPAGAHRLCAVYVRLSPAELADLDERRAAVRMRRSEYLRTAALGAVRPHVPEINRTAQRVLAGVARNVNQLAAHANAAGGSLDASMLVELDECRERLTEISHALIGARPPQPPREDAA